MDVNDKESKAFSESNRRRPVLYMVEIIAISEFRSSQKNIKKNSFDERIVVL